MHEHLRQASHNQQFRDCIEENFSDDFFDWKITVTFYTALHYLHALASKKGLFIGSNHGDVLRSVNPNNKNGCVLHLSYSAWNAFKEMYNYCHSARYDGITDFETWKKLKAKDYEQCLICMSKFETYIISEGISVQKGDPVKDSK
ncbi:MAG: hypothetical protein ACO1HD_08515 [Bacteroidota bacterium]|jgi:hypothetical protein